MDGPGGTIGTLPTNGPGLNGTLGDNAEGITPIALTLGGKTGVCGGMCGICGVIGVAGWEAPTIGTRGCGC